VIGMSAAKSHLVWLAVGLAACGGTAKTGEGSQGAADAGPDVSADTGSAPGSDANPPDASNDAGPETDGGCTTNESLAPARLMLLTDQQYVNAVRDVFGVDVGPDISKALKNAGEYAFKWSETTSVTTPQAQAYFGASSTVATLVAPCGTQPVDATCMEQFVRSKVPLAWRRPVTDQEVADLMNLFNAGLMISAARAVRVVMDAMLGSGSFLYRTELGKDATPTTSSVDLTPYELASAVSFAFFDSVPDAELRAKAADGTIVQPAVLSAQADRLLALPSVRDNLEKKVSYYLNFEKVPYVVKDPSAFAGYTPSVQNGLYRGARMFLDDIFTQGHFSDLFTSHRVYVNQEVASLYGIAGVTGTALVPIDSAPERAAGLLTQPAFLATTNLHTANDDVVHRGLYIHWMLACGLELADPPANEEAVFATITGTDRERWAKVDSIPACGACHKLFDALGVSSLNYDPIGRYRTTYPDNTIVDPSAEITGYGPDLDGKVTGIGDVAKKLATGRRASDCAATHLTTYTLDHDIGASNSCALQSIKDELSKNGSFPGFFKAIIISPAFLTRRWEAP
jgi:hypothetical protein